MSSAGRSSTASEVRHQLRQASLLESTGRAAPSVDNALIESFWSTMKRELLDRRAWRSRTELASAIFEWIEGYYNARPRQSNLDSLAPAAFEALRTTTLIAA